MADLPLEPKARKRIDQAASDAARRDELGAEAKAEFASHLFDAAQAIARGRNAGRVLTNHVDEALLRMGGDAASAPFAARPSVRQMRGLALSLCGVSAFIGLSLAALGMFGGGGAAAIFWVILLGVPAVASAGAWRNLGWLTLSCGLFVALVLLWFLLAGSGVSNVGGATAAAVLVLALLTAVPALGRRIPWWALVGATVACGFGGAYTWLFDAEGIIWMLFPLNVGLLCTAGWALGGFQSIRRRNATGTGPTPGS